MHSLTGASHKSSHRAKLLPALLPTSYPAITQVQGGTHSCCPRLQTVRSLFLQVMIPSGVKGNQSGKACAQLSCITCVSFCEGTEGSGPSKPLTPWGAPYQSSPSTPLPCLGHHLWGSSQKETDKRRLQKTDQAVVVQDLIYCVGGHWRLPLLPFLLPSVNLTFPPVSHSSSSCIQSCREPKKEERKKRHVCKGKEADGLAHGRAASLSRPQSGGAFLVCLCAWGVGTICWTLSIWHVPSFPSIPYALQIALECLIQAIHLPWTESLTARPGSSGSG